MPADKQSIHAKRKVSRPFHWVNLVLQLLLTQNHGNIKMIQSFKEAYLELSHTSLMGIFCENRLRLKVVFLQNSSIMNV